MALCTGPVGALFQQRLKQQKPGSETPTQREEPSQEPSSVQPDALRILRRTGWDRLHVLKGSRKGTAYRTILLALTLEKHRLGLTRICMGKLSGATRRRPVPWDCLWWGEGGLLSLFIGTFLFRLDFSSCAQSIVIFKTSSGNIWVVGFDVNFVFFFILSNIKKNQNRCV